MVTGQAQNIASIAICPDASVPTLTLWKSSLPNYQQLSFAPTWA